METLNKTQLAKILGMLGSNHDGEVINAARAAVALVKASGQTWFEIIGGIPDCGLDWLPTKKGGAYVDIQGNVRLVVFQRHSLWKFLINVDDRAFYDPRLFKTMQLAIMAAEETYLAKVAS